MRESGNMKARVRHYVVRKLICTEGSDGGNPFIGRHLFLREIISKRLSLKGGVEFRGGL